MEIDFLFSVFTADWHVFRSQTDFCELNEAILKWSIIELAIELLTDRNWKYRAC